MDLNSQSQNTESVSQTSQERVDVKDPLRNKLHAA